MSPGQLGRANGVRRESITLGIGPIAIHFVASSEDHPLLVQPGYLAFERAGARPDVAVECSVGSAQPLVAPVVFESNGVWELRRDAWGREQVYFPAKGCVGQHLFTLTLEPGVQRAQYVTVATRLRGGAIPLGHPIDEYLVSRLLGRRRGFILHASAIASDGRALLFVGHSGAGKSTVAEIADRAGGTVLTDERTIVTIDGSNVTAWGTPWHGTYAACSADHAPVGAGFLLVQDERDYLEVVDPGVAFSECFVRTVQPTADRDEVICTIDLLQQMVSRIPLYSLHFQPTAAAYSLAREHATSAVAGC